MAPTKRKSSTAGTRARKKASATSSATNRTPAPDATESSEDPQPTAVFAIDFGTSTFSACYAVKYGNNPIEYENEHPLKFQTEDSSLGYMVAAWDDNKFHFGFDLVEKVESGAVPADKVITAFKLLLYDTDVYNNSARVSQVKRRLAEAGKSIEQLLEESLRCIWNAILTWAEERNVDVAGPNQTVVYIPVPYIANKDATTVMSKAAKRAGIPRVRFVYEPLCAGASILSTLLGDRRTEATYVPFAGCCVQSVDMGGGTTDVVTLRLSQSLEETKRNKLVVLRKDGISCGATDVDESFRNWLKEQISRLPGGMEALKTKLLLTEDTIISQAVGKFDKWKRSPEQGRMLELRCSRVRQKENEFFDITAEAMRSFFDPHVKKIVALAKNNLMPETKYIVVSGGFAESNYVLKSIKQAFEPHGIEVYRSILRYEDCPVAKGALMIDDCLDQSKSSTSNQSVGLLDVDAMVNPVDHPDVYDSKDAQNKDKFIVKDRIRWLISKGAEADRYGNFTSTTPRIQQFYIPVTDPTVEHTVVFAARGPTTYDEPFRDERGKVLDGFSYRTEKTTITEDFVKRCRDQKRVVWLPDPTTKSKRRKEYLEVCCAFSLRYNNMSIDMIRQFVRPDAFPSSTAEDWVDRVRDTLEYDKAEWENIFDTNFDHEIIDSSVPDLGPPEPGPSSTMHGRDRSPTLQASPQPQRSQRQVAQPQPQHAAQNADRQMPHGLPHVPPYQPPRGKLPHPSQKSLGKRRMEDVDVNTVAYQTPFDSGSGSAYGPAYGVI